MPRAPASHHVVLQDRNRSHRVPLRIVQDDEGRLMYEWRLAPALAPSVSAEDLAYASFTPDLQLTWAQEDWVGGGLQFYYSNEESDRYALADKVWASPPNELSMGLHPRPITFGVRNGAAQLGATTNWSVSGVTLTAVTTAPHSGSYHFQGASWSTNDYCQVRVVQSEQPAARWVSQAITVTAKVRGASAGGQVRLQILETGGSSTPTTSGSAATLTTSYQAITAAVTLQADSTAVNIRVQMSADGGEDRTVYFDSVQCLPGTAVPNAAHTRMLMMGTDLLAFTDRAVWKLDETSAYWCLQKVHAASITGAEIYDNRLYIGQGESTVYQYSDAGDPTSGTASNLSSTADNANRFIKVLNVNGNWALAKTLDDDNVHIATDPTNSGSWGSAIEVGKDDHKIVQVFQLDGTIAVGKEDGFYRYLSLDGNRFVNVYPAAEFMTDASNFDRGIMHNGFFYTTIGESGLMRFDGNYWQSLSHIIRTPGFSELGNRGRAFGTDGEWLYLLVEDLNSDAIDNKCWLLALKEFTGKWAVHQVASLTMSDGVDIHVHKSSGGTNRFCYVMGDVNDEAFCYRLQLADRTDTPRLATNKDHALTGEFITSWIDWDRPQVYKAPTRFILLSENLSSSNTVTVSYQADNETSFTAINSTNSVFKTSPRSSIAFNENITARRIRFKLEFTASSTTSGPVVRAFVIEAAWRPSRLKHWTMTAAIEEGAQSLQGVSAGLSVSRSLTMLNLLKDEIAPIIIEDIDGVEQRGHIIDMAERQIRRHPREATSYARAVDIRITQALTAAAQPWNSGIRYDEFHWG